LNRYAFLLVAAMLIGGGKAEKKLGALQ